MSAANRWFPRAAGVFPDLNPRVGEGRQSSFWILLASVFLFAGAATFALVVLEANRGRPAYPPSEGSRAHRSEIPVRNPGLALRVEGQGDRLLLTWDRENPVLNTALAGILHIEDGSHTRDLQLDGTALRDGSVSYRPISKDVTFRMDIVNNDGVKESSVRVLDGTQPPVSRVPASLRLVEHAAASITQPVRQRRASTAVQTPKLNTLVPPSPALARAATPRKSPVVPPQTDVPNVKPTIAGDILDWQPLAAPATYTAPKSLPNITGVVDHQLSAAGPIYVPPKPVGRVMPDTRLWWPGLVSSQRKARVEVTLNIDTNGRVKNARILRASGNVNSLVVDGSLAAARRWRFEAATLRGKPVDCEHTLVFDFGPQNF